MENLNLKLYSNELFDDWVNRKGLIPAEKILIKKYLTDTSGSVLEAGTGGGRISFSIEKIGFKSINAFDIVPEMIEFAISRARANNSIIKFKTYDAANLSAYCDESFDYLIYLQQVLCFIPEDLYDNALSEAYRILKKGGIAIFSYTDWHSRRYNGFYSFVVNSLRTIRGEAVSSRYLPWLKLNGGKFNFRFLNKNQASVYWGEKKEIIEKLKNFGFSIVEALNSKELLKSNDLKSGMLYVVCRKD